MATLKVYQTGEATGSIFGEQTIYETSTECKYPLGTVRRLADGRVFRYTKNGTVALGAALLVQAAAPVAHHKGMTVSTAAIGDLVISCTDGGTAFTANQYAGGFLHINDGVGQGQTYKIKSHPSNTSTVACVFTLEEPIRVATATGTAKGTLTKLKYDGVIVTPSAAASSVVAGFTTIPVAASKYFWMCVKGPTAVLFGGVTLVIGQNVVALTEDGGVGPSAGDVIPVVGVVLQANVDSDYGIIMAAIPGE
jgi:hypothetical protein